MVEVVLLYDLERGVDQKAYMEWAKKIIGELMKFPGLIEYRAYRNLLGSPLVRSISVWKTLADWQRFFESEAWKTAEMELRAKFASNLSVELWGNSPIVPEPLRPKG
jgi:heme-degrading monooxygenase HmoA